MQSLDQKYIDRLDEIKRSIQNSEQLATYLDTEEDDDYLAIRRAFEPHLHDLYQEVADAKPMQIIDLENRIMDDGFEGLYLPKVLGYSILRGVVDEKYKFIRPQEQFKKVLIAITSSSNFDVLLQRIGQSIQIGFALSSDIWISNFIESNKSRRVRDFLTDQKKLKFRDLQPRRIGYLKYKHQFSSLNYHTADWPENEEDLTVLYPELKQFIIERILLEKPVDNLNDYVRDFASNKDFWFHWQFIYLFGLLANYFDFGDRATKAVNDTINACRAKEPNFTTTYFRFLKEILLSEIPVVSECNDRVSARLDKEINDDFTRYYSLMDILHTKGWIHEDSMIAVRKFYNQHEGLSTINECVRLTVYKFFSKIVRNLEPEEYQQVIDLVNVLEKYMVVFNNRHFAQSMKKRTLWFVKRFNSAYPNKRGKEYQTMKKFIKAKFIELDLMTDKEVKEFFRTPRKKRKEQATA